jgi:hypothetical protein
VLTLVLRSGTGLSFEITGFSDITYTQSPSQDSENKNGSFATGELDFYITQPIDEPIDMMAEVVIEAETNGQYVVDLERLYVGYTFTDRLKIRAGRFHNMLGYWNLAYHHGTHLQTTIGRPSFLEFEDNGGMLPVHVVGLWAAGRHRLEPFSYEYGVMIGNGASLDSANEKLTVNTTLDDNTNKSVTGRLRLMPNGLARSSVGISAYRSRVEDGTGSLELDQTILGADLVYAPGWIEFLSEIFSIDNRDEATDQGGHRSLVYYVQFGYSFRNDLTPYVRYEQVRVNEDDPYFILLGKRDAEITIGGLRYNLGRNTALKAEVRSLNQEPSDETAYAAQWTFTF